MIFGLAPIVLNETSYELALNASLVKAGYTVYTNLIGKWFWLILLFVLLIIAYIKTEDLSYVFIYGLLGLVGLGAYSLFPGFGKVFVMIILAIALTATLYSFFVKKNIA